MYWSTTNRCWSVGKQVGAVDGVVGKELGCRRKACQGDRTEKEGEAMTADELFILEGNEKAGELVKDGAEVDGGAMAAAKALTIKQLRENLRVQWSMRCVVTFFMKNGKTGMKLCRRKKCGNLYGKKEGRQHSTERCKDLGGRVQVHEMRREEQERKQSGHLPWLQVNGNIIQQYP